MKTRHVLRAILPVALALPEEMRDPISEVFDGLYDAPYFGKGLTILDIGANVGAFTLWANMRWPGSQIYAYEANPETFAILQRNVGELPNIHCVPAAVYPSTETNVAYFSRFAGDGEAGIVEVLHRMFQALPESQRFSVPVVHPAALPPADIVKIDTEGAEVAILEAMDLEKVSLVLLQYHYSADREQIKELLHLDFEIDYESAIAWAPLIPGSDYKSDLAGDQYGQLCFANRNCTRLERLESNAPASSGPAVEATEQLPAAGILSSAGGLPSLDRQVPPPSSARKRYSLAYLYDLLYVMVTRDMKLRYKRSVLGIAWSLLNPLAQLAVFGFVFRVVLPLDIPNYTAFLFIGILAWSWFQGALQQATGAIVENGALLGFPGFHVAVLPVVTVSSHLLHFVLALPVVVLFLLGSEVSFTPSIFLLPLIILIQFVISLSLAFIVATLQVFFRDTQYLLGVALMLGFFLTPIFYEPGSIPERFRGLLRLNPMYVLVEAYRDILVRGVWPEATPLVWLGLLSMVMLGAGHRLFSRASYHFVEQI